MHHESRRGSRQMFISFFNVFATVYINNIVLIFNELERHPEISTEQSHFFSTKG